MPSGDVAMTVLLFAAARQAVGSDCLSIQVPAPVTASTALNAIATTCPELRPLLSSCRLVVNHQYVDASTPIPADAELALIPPVSGG